MRDERELRQLKRIAQNAAFISWVIISSLVGVIGYICIKFF